ncbi:glycerophosphodiester phosphodiesterase GDPDL6 [Hevea brasiliensis]|nr:glycerophosphodiester phosphodiesterase GDPDL6 [Hevea brasiliensis]
MKRMIRCLLLISLLIHSSESKEVPAVNKKWLTLNGQPPAVIARGGLSGVFPESSSLALNIGRDSSLREMVMLCNLQLTKDGLGLCQENITLEASTNIDMIYPDQAKTYKINGKDVKGWFSVDFTMAQLSANVTVKQSISNRPKLFDNKFPILTVDDIFRAQIQSYWLNVQNYMFYNEHKLNVASYIQKERIFRLVNYISSPEIGFLKAMKGKATNPKTKLIFVFLEKDAIEPSTSKTYGSILEDLATVKTFASGIAVPKNYIWPVNKDNYLESSTTLVLDAHKLGLEVHATGFANDLATVYNYTYDPISEYLQFINNPQFSVDGVVSDFPPTASSALACFAHFSNLNFTKAGRPLIISHNGASGVYSNSTDLAYQQALNDGADIIDCSAQMTKDGTAFCMGSADLTTDTTATTTFSARSATIPEIQPNAGIFSFDLTWSEIQTLKPQLGSPFANGDKYPRNPAYKNTGKFVTLAEFLEFAKAKAASGVLINIENAAYLASKKGLDIVGAVSVALSNASFDKQSAQIVLIQSDDTSVLSKFQNVTAYERVFSLKKDIGDAPAKSVDEIKKFANAVNVPRQSIVPVHQGLAKAATQVVAELQKANLTVYVSVMRNEFFSLAFDFLSDPTLEIATFAPFNVSGIITEYPATANRFFRNLCSDLNYNVEFALLPIQLPYLTQFLPDGTQPPVAAPSPALDVEDVVDPPLPAVAKVASSSPGPSTKPKSPSIAGLGRSLLATCLLGLIFMLY